MKHIRTYLTVFLLLLLVGGVAAGGIYYWAARELPDFRKVSDYRPSLVTTVLARDKSVIGQFYHEKRFLVTLDEMPKFLPLAFLAAEDAQFYQHEGVDPLAIVRAFLANLEAGKARQGGSTITQQLIKGLVLSPERTYERKIKEAILAYRLEKHLSKNEILSIYLNHIFLGVNSYGVEAAARSIFGKTAKELNLAECALIAGLPQAPSSYNPYRYPDAAKNRQLYVLRRLREMQWISLAEYEQAVTAPLVYKGMNEGYMPEAAWYVEEVRRQLLSMFSEENAGKYGLELEKYGEDAVYELGLTVQTAMEPVQQIAANQALREGLEKASKRSGWNGPVERIDTANRDARLSEWAFHPSDLQGQEWVKALVTGVTEQGATVRLGAYNGFIDVKTMSWARQPNIKIAAANAPAVKDARKVLAAGDVVWTSAVADPKAAYNPTAYTQDIPIPLALQQYPNVQGALVSFEPQNGDVVAMVGGYNFSDSQFIRATQAMRQPGSSFKPIVYSAALDKGFTAGSIVKDAPVVVLGESALSTWRPKNYEDGFRGDMLLRTALALSRNMCTIRVAQQIGLDTVVERAKLLGFPQYFPEELSISLGAVAISPTDMARAYSAFANSGMVTEPRFIIEVLDYNGQQLINNESSVREAISPQNAFIMATLLKEVVNSGTGTRARVAGHNVGGKTGTTNEEQDAWFIGITPHLVSSIYLGYDQPRPMGKLETGGLAAAPIYGAYAVKALESYPPDDFAMPSGIHMVSVRERAAAFGKDGADRSFTLPFMEGTGPDATASGGPEATKPAEDLLKQIY